MRRFVLYISACLLLAGALEGEEPQDPPAIIAESYNAEMNITEITLRNGLKVILKPTSFDKNELFFQFIAPGGYATLEKHSRLSARIAARAALESGLGSYSRDQLASLQYREFVDISPHIDRFYRTINGSCRPESLKTALSLVRLIFEKHEIDKGALQRVVESEKKNYDQCHIGGQPTLNELYYLVNTQNSNGFKPIVGGELGQVDYKLAQSIFEYSFSQPGDFVGTLVGNFDMAETKRLLSELLATINNKEKHNWDQAVKKPQFPSGVNRREVAVGRQCGEEAATWITIPIHAELDQGAFYHLQIATKIMELRLRELSAYVSCRGECLDVFYDLPMFPYLNPVWVNIRFRCPKEQATLMEKAIVKEIERLRAEGPTDIELAATEKRYAETTALWQQYNSFWHSNLINCYLWGWNPRALCSPRPVTKQLMQEHFNRYISLESYTVINAYPG